MSVCTYCVYVGCVHDGLNCKLNQHAYVVGYHECRNPHRCGVVQNSCKISAGQMLKS